MGFSLNFILISSRCHLSRAKRSNIQETPQTLHSNPKGRHLFANFSQNFQFPKTCKNAPAQSESWTKGTHWRVPKNPKSLDVEAAAVHSTQHWSWKLLDVKFLWELSEISVFRFILTIYIFLLVLWQNKWRKTFITHYNWTICLWNEDNKQKRLFLLTITQHKKTEKILVVFYLNFLFCFLWYFLPQWLGTFLS